MKFMILQNMHDALGGITTVNITLANKFIEQGHEVCICSLRNGGYGVEISYPKRADIRLLNTTDEWGCPRYSQAISMIKKGSFIKGFHHIFKRLTYNHKMGLDLKLLGKEIIDENPDVIIVSHYELLNGIPQAYLARTVCHYHTSFDQVRNSKSQIALFKSYNNKIACFLWLSMATCDNAISFGLSNSRFIYNPLSFPRDKKNDSEDQHHIVYLGRNSKEKRIELLIDLFEQACLKMDVNDWKLIIYASGDMDDGLMDRIKRNPSIDFRGKTNTPQTALKEASIFALTSSFEGLPVVLLEAYACGIPCISFHCSEAMDEIMPSHISICIPKDDNELYVSKLVELMNNKDLRLQLGNEAYAFVEKFNIDSIYQQWMDLVEEMILHE